ncbi:MAG: hypothetical protein R3C56_26455 [Pirellulaceae bacterium]
MPATLEGNLRCSLCSFDRPLYHESIASRDVMAYLEAHGSRAEQAAAQRILVPAYATYVGNAGGYGFPHYGFPIYYGSVLAGHALGRYQAHEIMQLPENDVVDNEGFANDVQKVGFSLALVPMAGQLD